MQKEVKIDGTGKYKPSLGLGVRPLSLTLSYKFVHTLMPLTGRGRRVYSVRVWPTYYVDLDLLLF